jgi:hypothetical protein
MGAVIAAHAGEAVGKIPAAHELADDLRDDRSQEPEIVLVGLGVDVQERVNVLLTLDTRDFAILLNTEVYGVFVTTPRDFLIREELG